MDIWVNVLLVVSPQSRSCLVPAHRPHLTFLLVQLEDRAEEWPEQRVQGHAAYQRGGGDHQAVRQSAGDHEYEAREAVRRLVLLVPLPAVQGSHRAGLVHLLHRVPEVRHRSYVAGQADGARLPVGVRKLSPQGK